MKKVIKKVCCFILAGLFFTACGINVRPDTPGGGGNGGGDGGNQNPPASTEPQIQISITADYPDFTLDYTYDESTYIYTINLVSSITFDELTWYLNNSKLIGTENQMKINISAIAKKGVYHMLVTGVNNGIVYSAEMMFSTN